MTYYELIQKIKNITNNQPNINSFVRMFDDLNREDTKYSAIILQDQTHQRVSLDLMSYTFYLGYADRENRKRDNMDFNYSTGINVLNNIMNTLLDDAGIADVRMGGIICLEQKYLAECNVVYAAITITVPTNDCYSEYQIGVTGDFNDDFNNDYE